MNQKELVPLLVMPRCYALPALLPWNWCRVDETIEVASEVMSRLGGNLATDVLAFIRAFVAVTAPTRLPEGATPVIKAGPRERMLRYCRCCRVDGLVLHGEKLFLHLGNRSVTSFFAFTPRVPVTGQMFLPSGFVHTLMTLVRQGIVKVDLAYDSVEGDQFFGRSFFGEQATFKPDGKLVDASQEYWAWYRGQKP